MVFMARLGDTVHPLSWTWLLGFFLRHRQSVLLQVLSEEKQHGRVVNSETWHTLLPRSN